MAFPIQPLDAIHSIPASSAIPGLFPAHATLAGALGFTDDTPTFRPSSSQHNTNSNLNSYHRKENGNASHSVGVDGGLKLETIHIGQTTFLDPVDIARIVCADALPHLRSVKLVDVYRGSIWGPRVRRVDVERAVVEIMASRRRTREGEREDEPTEYEEPAGDSDVYTCMHLYDTETRETLERISRGGWRVPDEVKSVRDVQTLRCLGRVHRLVVCEALTERIMGGDRMDGETEMIQIII
jgi:hypothetical protein